jgi:hypothetical protein
MLGVELAHLHAAARACTLRMSREPGRKAECRVLGVHEVRQELLHAAKSRTLDQ